MQTKIYAHLKDIFKGKLYPSLANQDEKPPFGVYDVIYENDKQGIGVYAYTIEYQFSVSIYAKTYGEAVSLKKEVKKALREFEYIVFDINTREMYESELFRQMIDFKIKE